MRRGLTMVELLFSLALLSSIMLSIVAWTQVTARYGADAAGPLRWRVAAEAALRLIRDDVVAGDIGAGSTGSAEGRRRDEHKVWVEGDALLVRTRSPGPGETAGPGIHRYARDASSGALRRGERAGGGAWRTRPVLDRVREWRCEIDSERGVLTVAVASDEGGAVTRSYLLP